MDVIEVSRHQEQKRIEIPFIPDKVIFHNEIQTSNHLRELQNPELNPKYKGVEFIEYSLDTSGENPIEQVQNELERKEIEDYMLQIEKRLETGEITPEEAQAEFRNLSLLIELFCGNIPWANALEFCYREGLIDKKMFPPNFKYFTLQDNAQRVKEIVDLIFDENGSLKQDFAQDKSMAWFRNHIDASAIRERENLVQQLLRNEITKILTDTSDGEPINIKSFGGGLARTVLYLLAYMNNELENSIDVDLTLKDIDPNAQIASKKLARELGIEISKTNEGNSGTKGVQLRTHTVNLTKKEKSEVVRDPGRAHITEAIGLVEYLGTEDFTKILQNAILNLREGGVCIFGNMLDGNENGSLDLQDGTRAFSSFLEHAIGWGKYLKQRSIPETLDLLLSIEIEEGSGIYLEPKDIQVYYRPGAVYPIYVITKRMENKTPRTDQQHHQYQNGKHTNIYEGMIGK